MWSDPIQWGSVSNQSWVSAQVTAPQGAAFFYVRWSKVGEAAAVRGFDNVKIQRV
jgi:hypothetical protein